MRQQDLIPVRIKDRDTAFVGNEEETLSGYQSGFTLDVVMATAQSVLTCGAVNLSHRRAVALALDEDLLEYDSYQEEANSPLGREPVQIVLDEGPEAYRELQENIPENAYLYAAVHKVSVLEAAEELETGTNVYVELEDSVREVKGGYRTPDLVAATVVQDGEEYETDLRTFVPSTEWVQEYWSSVGHRRYSTSTHETEQDVELLEELAVSEAGDYIMDTVFHESKGSLTAHFVRGIEESPVEDEPSRLRYYCGRTTRASEDTLRLDVDSRNISINVCGNCEGAR